MSVTGPMIFLYPSILATNLFLVRFEMLNIPAISGSMMSALRIMIDEGTRSPIIVGEFIAPKSGANRFHMPVMKAASMSMNRLFPFDISAFANMLNPFAEGIILAMSSCERNIPYTNRITVNNMNPNMSSS